MRKSLSLRELLIMGGGLFSMHFGAACLLYPVTWGAEAGSAVYWTYLGVFLSGILLPWLGYLALAKGKEDFLGLICRAAPKFGTLFIGFLILLLGPVLMIPRVTAALWLGITQFAGWQFSTPFPSVLFNLALYSFAYFFISGKGKVLDRIGKYLFPVVILIVTAVIVKCTASPLAPRSNPVFTENPIAHGFLGAYAAGDLQCALVYGLVVVHSIHSAGIDEKYINGNLVKIGVVGLGLLAAAHLGHMIAGANTGGTINLRLSALYMQMVLEQWGSIGGTAFLAALCIAALSSSVGLASSTAGFWEKLLNGRFSYRQISAVTCVISCIISSLGIDLVVDVIGPLIDLFYPATIVVTFYYCFCSNNLSKRNLFAFKCSLFFSSLAAILALPHSYVKLFGLNLPMYERFYTSLPLSEFSLEWVPLTVLVYVAAYLYAGNSKN